jgi:hypothetical protein
MAYFILLKSLRSLEEFRKNPHVKIPPKSPCANFQSHGIFKNQILFGKEFFPSLPAHPAFQPAMAHSFFLLSIRSLPLFPLSLGLMAGPASPRTGGAPPNCHLPHRMTPPAVPPSPSLHARLTDGPHLSSLTFGPPELGHATTTSRHSPRRPALPRMTPELLPPRHHFPLHNPPLLTSPPPSMVLTPLTPPLLPRPPLSGAPPAPIKGR